MPNHPMRDLILKARETKRQEVYVPEWGQTVYVHEMSGRDRDKYEINVADSRSRGLIRARLVVLSVRDAEGNRIFADADADAVADMPAAGLSRVFNLAASLSGITESDREEIEKNS
ncbi:MAG: hypothetical protein JWM16_6196 [Verrucomicrobiales bacterium]|nr:hypothetical protein [Verrucomicrobiales bacterium]